nr:neutral/alkaline non-lysosomal ceramidase N-terminal domain-containing protein [Candidatus Sigynarchaeota archaeon]
MTFKAAIKSCVITPPVGVFQGGYGFRKKHAIGIHDDLHARCVVFSDGTTHAALVSLDTVSVDKTIVAKVKELASNVVPIPPANIIIAAIHTHSGPGPGRTLKGFPKAYNLYNELLPFNIAGLIYWTFNELQDASIAIGKGESFVGHHRRTWDQASNYVDRELAVVKVCSGDGKDLRGVLFNIGCHAVKMNPDNIYFSADWPGYTMQALGKVLGESANMFIQAPCGNINPWNQPFDNPPSTFDDCRQLGEMVAGDVLSALGKTGTPVMGLDVRAGELDVTIPIETESIKTKVQVILLGDYLAIVGIPGEPFSKFGRMIKDAVKTKHCIVQELVNNELEDQDEVAYIPTREAYVARDAEHPTGGYEVGVSIPNVETGYIITEAAIKLANELLNKR